MLKQIRRMKPYKRNSIFYVCNLMYLFSKCNITAIAYATYCHYTKLLLM